MYKILTFSTFLCMLLTISCTETPQNNVQPQIEVLKAKYGLRELSSIEATKHPLKKFTDLSQAESWLKQEKVILDQLKNRVPQMVTADVKLVRTIPGARSLFLCENSYLHVNMGGAGMFSSWEATWYQDQQMGPVDVNLTSHGLRVGWSYQQNKVYKLHKQEFCVQGTITIGGDFLGLPLGHDEAYYVKVGLNRDCKVEMTEGYGFCGM